jgi:hypothetical protein
MARVLTVVLAAALALCLSCGGSSSANDQPTPGPIDTPAPSPTPLVSTSFGSVVAVIIPFNNAAQARASLLGTARVGTPMDAFDNANPLDITSYPGWQRVYPTLRLLGPTANATPMAVSVYRGVQDATQPASAANPKVIAFAVADANGGCAGGAIRGFPIYDRYEELDIGPAACTAQSVLAALRR